ncbi:MAG: DUF4249 family protein [Rhodothermales bacterium]
MTRHLLTLILLSLAAGCDSYRQDDFEPEYVVESYLIAGEALPALRLSTTASIEHAYAFETQGVRGATASISLLDGAGIAERYPLVEISPGLYEPVDNDVVVLAGRRYALGVTTPDGTQIQAQTLVPGDFDLFPPASDTIVYRQQATFTVDVTESAYPGRSAIYILKLHASDTTGALTPLYQGWLDDEIVTREELIDNNSGILNEANFEPVGDGRLRIVLPWIAVAFFGENEVVVDAIDDNLFDFIRTREDNGTRPLGELENPVDHVDGARGIFGSLARRQMPVYIHPD